MRKLKKSIGSFRFIADIVRKYGRYNGIGLWKLRWFWIWGAWWRYSKNDKIYGQCRNHWYTGWDRRQESQANRFIVTILRIYIMKVPGKCWKVYCLIRIYHAETIRFLRNIQTIFRRIKSIYIIITERLERQLQYRALWRYLWWYGCTGVKSERMNCQKYEFAYCRSCDG